MKNRLWINLFYFTVLMFFISPALAVEKAAPKAAEKRRVEVKPKVVYQSAEHRIALVIGNGSYRIGALRNPANDARAFAAALRGVGFEVDEQINLSYQDMGRAINRFGKSIRRDSVALFYYAGHGLQVQGSNYLVPVDMEIQDEGEVQFNTVNAGQVLAKMEEAKNPVNIVILDACRDNPYARSFKRSSASRGLAPMDAPVGSFVAYAAAPGKTADDGKGKNGLYTESLVRQIKNPGMKIEDVFKRVRSEVRRKSGGSQIPEERSSLEGDFYFAGGSMAVEEPPAPSAVREPATGKLTVKSNVGGAKVYIDGAYKGDDPVSSTLKPGTYSVVVKKEGYPDAAETVRIEAGGAKTISIVMEKPAPLTIMENKAGDVYRDPTTGMELVLVKGGCYRMGDVFGDGKADAKPVHEVCVNDFYLGKYEVTVGQFKKFVTETGYLTDAERNASSMTGCFAFDQDDKEKAWDWRGWASWKKPNKYQDNKDDHPVSCVSWNDAKIFADWIPRKDGKNYRMPTEAEWEYAARGGTETRNYWGDGKDDSCIYANVLDRTPLPGGRPRTTKFQIECTDGYAFVAPVGRFQPNAFGLYDMIGNVEEWTQDWYDKEYYGNSPRNNPRGPSNGSYRVWRGGSFLSSALFCGTANRSSIDPGSRGDELGFRLLMTVAISDSPSIDKTTSVSGPREPARDGRFIAYENGTVLDTKTNLMWAAKDNGSNINWADAKSYCENYSGGGYTDWRMPTQDELAGLYDKAKTYKSDCGYDVHLTELIRLTCTWAWASETRGSDAALFDFVYGYRVWNNRSNDTSPRALPVRSGK